MAFYWRGNQVFTKQGPIDDDDKGWTTFLMDTRVPIEVNISFKTVEILQITLLIFSVSLFFNN